MCLCVYVLLHKRNIESGKKENVGGSTVQFQVDALCTKTGRARPVLDLPSSLRADFSGRKG